MKELNGVKIIGIDHGYGNIKSSCTVTPTGLFEYETEPVFSGNILEYNGTYYRVGEGHKEFIADKSTDDEYYIFTLMAIAKELSRVGITSADVHIAAGLPLTWVRSQREEFRKYLMQKGEVDFRFNDKQYHIRIVGSSIFPQGYPAIVERISQFTGTNILADIGNGTMNIMYINNKKPIESKCWTEKLGVNQCMIAAKNSIMDKFGVKIEDSVVEQYLRFKKADISKEYLDCLNSVATEYTEQIFSALRRYEYNSGLMRLYIIGGGGCLVENFGKYDKDRVTIISDICATAKGYEYLAYNKLRKEQNR